MLGDHGRAEPRAIDPKEGAVAYVDSASLYTVNRRGA
jgi:hypothetical protein